MRNGWDIIGAIGSSITGLASAACALHCAATPVLISVLPLTLPHLHVPEPVERGLIAGSLLLAVISLLSGYRRHQVRWPLWLLAGGALSFGLAHLTTQVWFGVLGGAMLAIAHLWNRKACHKQIPPS
jgi:hypothetical protein